MSGGIDGRVEAENVFVRETTRSNKSEKNGGECRDKREEGCRDQNFVNVFSEIKFFDRR